MLFYEIIAVKGLGIKLMIVNLIKSKKLYSLTLPNKIKGQYWLSDNDNFGKPRNLLSIEAINNNWVIKSSELISILNPSGEKLNEKALGPAEILYIKISDCTDRAILATEDIDVSRQILTKVIVDSPETFEIGRMPNNHISFNNHFVSSRHAKLCYNGQNWSVIDMGSTNGVFVNGFRVDSQDLDVGDLIYIVGLKIIIGSDFFAINNPDNQVRINSDYVSEYLSPNFVPSAKEYNIPTPQYFFRSPRFHREVEHLDMSIDPPPQREKVETVPLALMLGPSLTMGMASLSTGILSVTNAIVDDKPITSVLPTLTMSFSMLCGTVLWPILTKRYEKKLKVKTEGKRQSKYLAYLDEIRDNIRRKSKEQSEILNGNLIELSECINRIADSDSKLWERVIGQPDFLKLRLGLGTLPLDAEIKYPEKRFSLEDDNLQDAMLSLGAEPKQLINVPIGISLTQDNFMGIFGSYGQSVNTLKSLILQMIALHSYDELKIMLITDSETKSEWEFVKWIPHFWDNNKKIRFFATNSDEIKELSSYVEKNILIREDDESQNYDDNIPYYVIINTSNTLFQKSDSFRQLLSYQNNCGFSIIFLTEELKDLPKETKLVVWANGQDSQLFDKDDTSGKKTRFATEAINERILDGIAEDIANIELDLSDQRYSLPDMITFLEMFHVSKIEHLNILTRWKENNPTISLQAPVGVDTQGDLFYLDLHEKYHGPHGLVAGMTGSGKSEFIITYILSLAVNYHPDEVSFILIDYKGGGLTGAFEDSDRGVHLPHLAGTITNLDGAAIQRSLISIQSELRRRQAVFNEARKISNEGTMDIYKYQQLYRDKIVSEPIPHLFIISDEFAELKTQQPEFMEQLISTARIGRSLGVHLILATQKPSGVVDDQIWSNSKFRVCLKVQDKQDSQDMIKRPDAAEISQTGRFYLQVGFNEFFALGQSAWCGAEYIPTDKVEKNVDNSIQIIDNLGRTIVNAKPAKKQEKSGSKIKQIVSVVKYLSDLAVEENISVRPLWLDPIPEYIYLEDIERKYGIVSSGTYLNPVVGEYDDPFNQKQGVLTVPISSDGNCLVYGATGNGKTTFLTTLCYSLIKNHSAKELNLYIMDFGSETLKSFEKAPQVGGVVISSDEEKTINLIKLLMKEIDYRKKLFSEFGGDYASYCKNSKKVIPNIVVVINNFAGFEEQYENLYDKLVQLTRDGVKYGIYFVMSSSSPSGVRYRLAQNFKTVLTMQLNDPNDYLVLVGRTEGLIPTKYKGRGLVNMGKVYEFQTAYCQKTDDISEFIRNYCVSIRKKGKTFAKKIPVLPEIVSYEYISDSITDFASVPIGVGKKDLEIASVNMTNRLIMQVMSIEAYQCAAFAEGLIKVLSAMAATDVIDIEQVLSANMGKNVSIINSNDLESFTVDLFNDMVKRNNTYKSAGMTLSSLNEFKDRAVVIIGMSKLFERLSSDGKDKLKALLEKGEAIYKIHFFIFDAVSSFSTFNYDNWYKRHLSGAEGLYIGDGLTDQYVLKPNKITRDLYEEIGDEYGYILSRSRPNLIKLLSPLSDEG